jgi:CHRD domain
MYRWGASMRVFVAMAASAMLMSSIAIPAQAQLRQLQQQQSQKQQQLQTQSSSATPGTAFSASFSGFEEIGALGAGETGAIFSPGQGQLSLSVDTFNRIIHFTLTYSGLSSDVTQSHIHFGKEGVAGGIMVFFCSNLPNPPSGTQVCPLPGGTVTGTIAGVNVIGPTAQNVSLGNFDALLAALNSNTAYGNIHTKNFPSGEIRGQILPQ